MKKLLMILPLVFLLLLTFSCQKAEEVAEEPVVAPLSDEDISAIKATFDKYVECALSGDWDNFVSLFTEDAILMPPNEPILQGREAYREYMQMYPAYTEVSLPIVEIDGCGDLAFARGTVSVKI